MKPLMDTPTATASTQARSHKRKSRSLIAPKDVLKPMSTALTQELIDIIEAEAALEYIKPAQVLRRIILSHYKPLLKG